MNRTCGTCGGSGVVIASMESEMCGTCLGEGTIKQYAGMLIFQYNVYAEAPNYQEAQRKLIARYGQPYLDQDNRGEVIVEELDVNEQPTDSRWATQMNRLQRLFDATAEQHGVEATLAMVDEIMRRADKRATHGNEAWDVCAKQVAKDISSDA